MSYYRTCEFCGCNLDPGEICDCRREGARLLIRPAHGAKNGKEAQKYVGTRRKTAVAV